MNRQERKGFVDLIAQWIDLAGGPDEQANALAALFSGNCDLAEQVQLQLRDPRLQRQLTTGLEHFNILISFFAEDDCHLMQLIELSDSMRAKLKKFLLGKGINCLSPTARMRATKTAKFPPVDLEVVELVSAG
jgi:hypothetical protein